MQCYIHVYAVLNQWKEQEKEKKEENKEKAKTFESYVNKLEYVRGKVDHTSNQLNVIHKRINDMRELIRKRSGNKNAVVW